MRPSGRYRSLALAFADATCLPAIRRWLRANVVDRDTTMNAELVCTELVTNAVEHGGGNGDVRIEVSDDGQVYMEVDDSNPTAVLTVGRSRLGTHRGRGLQIVDSLAAWGILRTAHGKTVWAGL